MKTAIFILILTVITSSAFCKTITVTSSADSGVGTLRQAVLDAESGDVIVFEDSITSIHLLLTINISKSITINGNRDRTITVTSRYRHFYIKTEEGAVVNFNYLTLRDGHVSSCGGAILNKSSNVLSINNCFFINNKADDNCGAILNSGKLIINNCIFDNNISTIYGAGAISSSGEALIYNTIFTNNITTKVSTSSGALYNNNSGIMTVKNCLFKGNKGHVSGCLVNRGKTNVYNCLFIENTSTSTQTKGVIYNFRFTPYDVNETSLTIVNSTITGNVGEGIYNSQELKLYNSIVCNNNAINDIYNDSTGTISTVNNLIGTCNINLPDSGNIYNTDPLFVDSDNNDYSLQATSPAINAGNNNYMPDSITLDLADNPRISGTAIDIGAYEYKSKPITSIKERENKLYIYTIDKNIIIANTTKPVYIYNIQGTCIANGICKNTFTVPLLGVYIVRVGNTTQKIIVQ